MSTIATRISTAKLQVGTAALAAVVAAATLTPAIAEAAPPSFVAPITQALGGSVEEWIVPVVNSSAPGDVSNAAVVNAFQPFAIIDGVVKFFANIVYESLNFIGDVFILAANAVARIFRVGPYATSG